MNTNMWQRIQTVFLGGTIITLTIALIMPLWMGQADGTPVVLTPFYLVQLDQYDYIPYSLTAALLVAGLTISLIEIRRYDNRLLQMKLGLLNTVFLLGAMICVVSFSIPLSKQFSTAPRNGLGTYLIFAAVLFNWLALRFIRRDERLVRDSDRLR